MRSSLKYSVSKTKREIHIVLLIQRKSYFKRPNLPRLPSSLANPFKVKPEKQSSCRAFQEIPALNVNICFIKAAHTLSVTGFTSERHSLEATGTEYESCQSKQGNAFPGD